MDHPISEYVFWWTQSLLLVGVVAAAGAAAYIAWSQLKIIASQAKATLLLELDRRFEGCDLAAPRGALRKMRDDARSAAREADPRANDQALLHLMKPECARIIGRMRDDDRQTYAGLMNYLGFFETVGVMVEQGYLELAEVNRLFRGAILDIDLHFGGHIAERQREAGVAKGLFENTLNLLGKIRLLPE